MIRLSKFLTILLPLPTIFFQINTNAQRAITPANVTGAFATIEIDYGDLISIPTSDLTSYLQAMMSSTSTAVLPPIPTVDEIIGSTIVLSWPNSLSNSEYRVGHMDLTTGAEVMYSFLPAANNSYNIPNVSTGIHLLAVQAKTTLTGEWEGVYVIIIDKTFHKVVLTDDIGCDCSGYLDEIDLENYSGGPWPSIPIGEPFQLRIHNSLLGEDEGIIHGLRDYNGGNSWTLNFNIKCDHPEPAFYIEEEFDVLRFHKGDDFIGAFNFAPEFWKTHFGTNQYYKIFYSQCRRDKLSEGRINANQQENWTALSEAAYPNPFTNELNIILPDLESEINSVELYSVSGILVKKAEYQKAGHKIVMNTSNLPSGSYFCIIKTATDIKRLQLVKP